MIARGASGERRTTTSETGQFNFDVPSEVITLRVEGQYIKPQELTVPVSIASGNLRIEIDYLIPSIHQSIVITASALEPQVETHSDEVYKRNLLNVIVRKLYGLQPELTGHSIPTSMNMLRFVAIEAIEIETV